MKLVVRQTGGFVGLIQHQLDSARLSSDKIRILNGLVQSGLREFKLSTPAPVENKPRYEIEIKENSKSQIIKFNQGPLTEELNKLARFIQNNGQPVSTRRGE